MSLSTSSIVGGLPTLKIRTFWQEPEIGMLYDMNSDRFIRTKNIQAQLAQAVVNSPDPDIWQPDNEPTLHRLSSSIDIADLFNLTGDQRPRFHFGLIHDRDPSVRRSAECSNITFSGDRAICAIKYAKNYSTSEVNVQELDETTKENLKQALYEAVKDDGNYAAATHLVVGIQRGFTGVCSLEWENAAMEDDEISEEIRADIDKIVNGDINGDRQTNIEVSFFTDCPLNLPSSHLDLPAAALAFKQMKELSSQNSVVQSAVLISLEQLFQILSIEKRFVFSRKKNLGNHLISEWIEKRIRRLALLRIRAHRLTVKAKRLHSTAIDNRISRFTEKINNCLDTFNNEMRVELAAFYGDQSADNDRIMQLTLVSDGFDREASEMEGEIERLLQIYEILSDGCQSTIAIRNWTFIERRHMLLSQLVLQIPIFPGNSRITSPEAVADLIRCWQRFFEINAELKHYELAITCDQGAAELQSSTPVGSECICWLWKAKSSSPTSIDLPGLLSLNQGTIKSHSIELRWQLEKPMNSNIFSQFAIMKRGIGEVSFTTIDLIPIRGMQYSHTVEQLEPTTNYEFVVALSSTQGYSAVVISDICSVTTTKYGRAQRLKEEAQKTTDPDWKDVSFYVPKSLPSNIYSCGSHRRIVGGEQPGALDKVILLVGGTGSGKSTFFSALLNWLYEVELGDDFRFRYISPELERRPGAGEAGSATHEILPYVLTNTRLPWRLHVIDTAGFGDTQGLAFDKENTKRFRDWFEREFRHGLDQIDAVFVVMKSSDDRLNAQAKFELSQILSLFSTNIEQILVPIFTFADGNRPTVLKVLSDLRLMVDNEFFKFNSGAVMGNQLEEQNKIQWRSTMDEFEKLFRYVDELPTQSFEQSHEVCLQREILEQNVLEMKRYIAAKVVELESLIDEMSAMKKHIKAIDENKNFILEVTRSVEKKTKIPGNFFDTRCKTCDFLCHRNCDMATEGDKENCWAMDYWGDCKICPGKCSYKQHKNVDHRIEFEKVKMTETDQDMKRRYGQSVEEKLHTETVLKKIAEQMMSTELDIRRQIARIRACLKRLDAIAMRRSNLDDSDYIKMEIKREQEEGEQGWQVRVHFLQQQLELAAAIGEARDDNYDPFVKYKEKALGWLDYLKKSFPKMTETIDEIANNLGGTQEFVEEEEELPALESSNSDSE